MNEPPQKHFLEISHRAFLAILSGSKKVEYRTNTLSTKVDFSLVKSGDKMQFIDDDTGEALLKDVSRVTRYKSAEDMYRAEGLKNSSSKPRNITEAVTRIESFTGYKEGIKKNGIWAIEID